MGVRSVLRKLPLHKLFSPFRIGPKTEMNAMDSTQEVENAVSNLAEMTEFYAQFFENGNLVFDVGANLGNRSQAFLELGAQVVAFEPQKTCVEQLQKLFDDNPNFELVSCVLGAAEGTAELMVCEASTISSLSTDWIDAVKTSGRFSEFNWDKKSSVPMNTLDQMIHKFGSPTFIKIDVEGSELNVLKGLSRPVASGSFEFVPEFIDSTLECIRHLEAIGESTFNYCVGERLELVLDGFVSGNEMIELLTDFVKADPDNFGDVYFRQVN